MKVLARNVPSPEFINLMVGILSATAINILTSIALGGSSGERLLRSAVCGGLLLACSVALGGVSVIVTHVRDDALSSVPASFSIQERKSLVKSAMLEKRGYIGTLSLICGFCVVASASALLIPAYFFRWLF